MVVLCVCVCWGGVGLHFWAKHGSWVFVLSFMHFLVTSCSFVFVIYIYIYIFFFFLFHMNAHLHGLVVFFYMPGHSFDLLTSVRASMITSRIIDM